MGCESILQHNNPWNDSDVEAHWDKVSNIYIKENEKVKNVHDQRFVEAVTNMDLKPNSKVLNITSRDCELVDYIFSKEPSANVLNAEISQGLIDVAKKIRPKAEQIKIKTYSKLPFTNGQFNRIVSLETLEHVASPISFLKELHRVSTQDTRFVLSCPPLTSELAYRIFTYLFGGHGEGPHRFLSSREVKVLLNHTGWKLLLHKGTILFPIGPLFLQKFGEWIISKFQRTFISELGIRQFYVCEKI